MAASAANFVHKNCSRSTRFNCLNAGNFAYKHASRCYYFSSRSASCIFVEKKRTNSLISPRGVSDKRQEVNNLVFRCTSTDTATLVGRYQQLKKILYDFYLGFKHLFNDVKLTWKIRRKLRANNGNYDVLTRKDLWKMFKTQKNLKKTLPIVALSCLPVVGYLGPIIGFLRPRTFLSYHFWTAKQREKFIALDSKERAEHRYSIFNFINEETKKPGNREHQLLHKITMMADLDIDAPVEKAFSAFSSGIFKLENLERKHLQKLCSFWIMRSWWPSFLLKRNLKKEMIVIHKDDVALAREGIETLSEKQLKEACHVRGLDTSNMSSSDLHIWLESWLDVSKHVSENETSFLAHHAVFKALDDEGVPRDDAKT